MKHSNNGSGEQSPLLGGNSAPTAASAVGETTTTTTNNNKATNSTTPVVVGDASISQTIVNMAKTCMGTGCLVLPFAARQGGLLLHTIGLVAIAAWNIYTVQRLCLCLDYLPQAQTQAQQSAIQQSASSTINNETDEEEDNDRISKNGDKTRNTTAPHQQHHHRHQRHPPAETAMFGKVVWYAVGPTGLIALDILMVSFLIGILVTYMNAMRSFLRDTPLTTHSDLLDALGLVAIMGPMSCVPHMGYLARASAMGLLVLAATFVVLGIYGLDEYQHDNNHAMHDHDDNNNNNNNSSSTMMLSLLPENGLWGVSHWFGCVVFSFGVAPLTYNFRSSMADPSRMVPATGYALMGVALAYMGLGIGFWILFPNLESDLLQELPMTGWLPVVTRLAMVVVVLTTAPLLIVPCGELMESKISHAVTRAMLVFHSPNRNHDSNDDNNNDDHDHHQFRRILFRFGICFLGVGISIYVPGFVDVLSFVGCCCVACLGFCIPPLLHALLCFQARHHRPWSKVTMAVDVVMLSWGVFATIVSTTYTFRQISVGSAS